MKKKIAIVGGGACALMLACELDPEIFEVSVYEKNAAPGRKFLVAGEGGLNLTHSENSQNFLSRYTPPAFLEKAFTHFSNKDFVTWINNIGVETYVGSSGRVFPKKGIKPVEVLNVILDKIKKNQATILTKHSWKGFSKDQLVFENNGSATLHDYDVVIFCLGGASWPVTGSTGEWTAIFKEKNIKINPFRSSNCAFRVHWDAALVPKLEGKVLKNISITCDSKKHLGEVVLTRFGLEGSGIYPLSPEIRTALESGGEAVIAVDFKPDLSVEKLTEKLHAKAPGKNITEHLKTGLHLSDVQVVLLKHFLSKENYLDVATLAQQIKQFRLRIEGLGPMEDAISTVGGIDLEETDETFQLKKMPGKYVIGEMLDYDAPTGGYLLQSCFSMAKYLADHLNSITF